MAWVFEVFKFASKIVWPASPLSKRYKFIESRAYVKTPRTNLRMLHILVFIPHILNTHKQYHNTMQLFKTSQLSKVKIKSLFVSITDHNIFPYLIIITLYYCKNNKLCLFNLNDSSWWLIVAVKFVFIRELIVLYIYFNTQCRFIAKRHFCSKIYFSVQFYKTL